MNKTSTLFLAVTFAMALALGTSGCGRQDGGKPAVKAAVLTAPLPRDKFLELAGQPESLVLERVGKADAVNDYAGSMGVNWVYLKKSVDPATGKVDDVATLVFKNGVVAQIIFK